MNRSQAEHQARVEEICPGKWWVYHLGPFTSRPYSSEKAARTQLTKHAKRGLTSEFLRRQGLR